MSNAPQPPDHNQSHPQRTADLMSSQGPRGAQHGPTGAAALRPDAEEGALAWTYLAIVGVLFILLVFFAWACNDEREAGGTATADSTSTTAAVAAGESPGVGDQSTVPPTTEVTVDLVAVQESIAAKLLANPITFEVSEATIASGDDLLVEIAEDLKTLDARITVEGYTDSGGDEAENKILSEERAQAVADRLVALGVSAGDIDSVGFGEEQAVQDSPTDAQKAADRKIEIKLEAAG